MDEYTKETNRRLDALRTLDIDAYTQLLYCPAFRLSETDVSAQLDMYQDENEVTL